MKNNITFNLLNHFFVKQFGGGKHKWTTLFHSGLVFPEPYIPHNVPLKYRDQYIHLPPTAEEFAMIYVKYLDTDYIKNKLFNKNFWHDWKHLLPSNTEIQSFEEIDFSEYHNIFLEEKEKKSCKTPEEKQEEKEKKKEFDEKYKIAIVDGKEQEISSYYVEPPGIFLGRGSNPLIGKIKRRLEPEDFTINIGKDMAVPETLPGHHWGDVVHNQDVEWIASWIDSITGKNKYIWLSSSSNFKANNDYKKFELARKLKKRMKKIININTNNLSDSDPKIRQLATALYFIDRLAIRVGNEKGEDETDTVGCTTLRLEHIKLEGNVVTLDFLGKDSVPYYGSMVVDEIVKNNIESFIDGKEQYERLFDLIDSADLNTYLQTFMKDLTAKTIRTFRASEMFQKELLKIDKRFCGQEPTTNELIEQYNLANLKVAKYLNHQKNVSKGYKEQMDKINNSIRIERNRLRKELAKEPKNTTQIQKIKTRIRKLKEKKLMKEQVKNLSLTTSKQNYVDPRISISFMKRHNIPVEKLFTKQLQKKFKWAFDAPADFHF